MDSTPTCHFSRSVHHRLAHVCPISSVPNSRFQGNKLFTSQNRSVSRMVGKRKRNRRDSQAAPPGSNEPEVESPGVFIQSGDGPGREACPFLPLVSTATYYLWPLPARWSQAQPASPVGKSIVQKNWLQLRRIARSEWVELPIQECATCPWCTVCEHLHSGNRPEARRAMSAYAGWVPTDSICDSETEHWEWDLHVAGGCCPSVPEPPLPLQPNAPFQPRFLLQGLIRAHCPFQLRWSLHGSHLTKTEIYQPLWQSFRCTPYGSFARTQYIILEARAELPDPSETTPARWLGQATPEYQLSQPAVRHSATGPPPPP